MDIFKGYIPMKGKRPLEEYKDRKEFYTLDYIRRTYTDYGGVLRDDIVQIDLDSDQEAEIVKRIITDLNLQCCILKTDRGMHFYFKNTDLTTRKVKAKASIGVTIDVGLGSKNAIVPLRMGDKTRRWLNRPEEVDSLPDWLKPVKKVPDFINMGEGDGRNQELFNYILTLQTEGLSNGSIKEILTIINTYILKNPLSEKELQTIMREEAFMKPSFYIKKTFQHHRFAKFIKAEEKIIKINNVLHIYNSGIYTTTDIEASLIKHLPELNQAKRSETLTYLQLIAENTQQAGANYIAFKNGVLDTDTMELGEFSPDLVLQNRIDYDYIPTAYDEVVNKTLDKICCRDREQRLLLEEMVGFVFLRRSEMGKCFILTGSGSNGKSTLLDMIKHMLGSRNYSSLSLEELGERFKTAELFNKLANIGDDISKKYLDDDAIFKKLVTGESVNVERKGKDPFEFNNHAKLIFSANKMPRINDTSDGLMRRLEIIPFNAVFSRKDEDFDPFIKDKLLTQSAMEYLISLGIQGLKRILSRGFTESEASKREKADYELINNPVMNFIREGNKILNEPAKEVYLRYGLWCQENGLKSLSNIEFGRELLKQGYASRVTTIDGKAIRVYTGNES